MKFKSIDLILISLCSVPRNVERTLNVQIVTMVRLVPLAMLRSLSCSEANHETLNTYFAYIWITIFVATRSYFMVLDGLWRIGKFLQFYMLMRQNFVSIWYELS